MWYTLSGLEIVLKFQAYDELHARDGRAYEISYPAIRTYAIAMALGIHPSNIDLILIILSKNRWDYAKLIIENILIPDFGLIEY